LAIKDERALADSPRGRLEARTKRKHPSRMLLQIEGLLVALCMALFIRAFFVQAFKIPSGSMKDTLLVGDYLLISKFTYWFTPPQRGDIVVFKEITQKEDFTPGDWIDEMWVLLAYDKPSRRRDLVKRLIALPGDTLEVRDGLVYINGKACAEPYVKEGSNQPENDHPIIPAGLPSSEYEDRDGAIFVRVDLQSLAAVPGLEAWRADRVEEFKRMATEKRAEAQNDRSTRGERLQREAWELERQANYLSRPFEINVHRLSGPALENVEHLPPLVIPEGYCFVMGDNRNHSADSRFFGFLPLSYIRGRAEVIYWSSAPSTCRDDDESETDLGARCNAELYKATAAEVRAGANLPYSDVGPADFYWVCRNPECEYKGSVYRNYWDKIALDPADQIKTGIPIVDGIANGVKRFIVTTRWDRIGKDIIPPGPTKFLND
jgi:signal peptidase I